MLGKLLTSLKYVAGLTITAAKAVRSYFADPHAVYKLEFEETGFRYSRNAVLLRDVPWSDVYKVVLWQTDALTTECDHMGLYIRGGQNLEITDFNPRFHALVDFMDGPFPGFEKIFRVYSGSATGKWGDVEPLRLDLKLGEAPTIVSGKVDNRSP